MLQFVRMFRIVDKVLDGRSKPKVMLNIADGQITGQFLQL